ncbi:hypothetical protein BDAP_001972 [Binucleata daphniae]
MNNSSEYKIFEVENEKSTEKKKKESKYTLENINLCNKYTLENINLSNKNIQKYKLIYLQNYTQNKKDNKNKNENENKKDNKNEKENKNNTLCCNKSTNATKFFISIKTYKKNNTKILCFIKMVHKNMPYTAIQKYNALKDYNEKKNNFTAFWKVVATKNNYKENVNNLLFVYIINNNDDYNDSTEDNRLVDNVESNNLVSFSTKSSHNTTPTLLSSIEIIKSDDSPPPKKIKITDYNESKKQKALKILENEIQNIKIELLNTKRYFAKPRPFYDFESSFVHKNRFYDIVKSKNEDKFVEFDMLKTQIQNMNDFYVSAKNLPLSEILKRSRKTVLTEEWMFARKEKKTVKKLSVYYKMKNKGKYDKDKKNKKKTKDKKNDNKKSKDSKDIEQEKNNGIEMHEYTDNDIKIAHSKDLTNSLKYKTVNMRNNESNTNDKFVTKQCQNHSFYLPEYILDSVSVKYLLIKKNLNNELKIFYKNNCVMVDENKTYAIENVYCYKKDDGETAKPRKPKTQERFLEIYECMRKKQTRYTYTIPMPRKGVTNIHSSHLSVLGKVIPDIGRLQSPYAILEYKEKMKQRSYGRDYTRSINRML